MTKKLAIPAVLTSLALAFTLTACTPDETETPTEPTTPTPTTAPTNNPGEGIEYEPNEDGTVPLGVTNQFIEASSLLGDHLPEDIRSDYAGVVVATYTAYAYANSSFNNPYLLADYWAGKDKFMPEGIQESTKWLTGDAKQQADENLKKIKGGERETAWAWFNDRIYMPTTNVDFFIQDTCTQKWDLGSCRLNDPEYTNWVISDEPDGTVHIKFTANVTPVFNGPDGVWVERRAYDMTMTLKLDKMPTDPATTDPIYKISNLDGKLVQVTPEKLF